MDKSKRRLRKSNDISYVPVLFPWTNLFEEKPKVVKKPIPQVEDEESEKSFFEDRPVMDD